MLSDVVNGCYHLLLWADNNYYCLVPGNANKKMAVLVSMPIDVCEGVCLPADQTTEAHSRRGCPFAHRSNHRNTFRLLLKTKHVEEVKELTWSTLKPNNKAHREQQHCYYVDAVTNEQIFVINISLGSLKQSLNQVEQVSLIFTFTAAFSNSRATKGNIPHTKEDTAIMTRVILSSSGIYSLMICPMYIPYVR